ncbi:CHAT domain-containing protein [Neosynechococcus sphagnicola]|uniref:CHAT domain-containing protein n=1 Tax=Neosynechococcus sphagnicola TaxID=1501145 RepID=UPI00068CDB76|nr:CHAT domain-containing protein [Neosynechococcus sphagnicola]
MATAVQQAQALEDPRSQSFALGSLAMVYEHTQQWQSAQHLTQQALQILQFSPDLAYRWQWQLGRILKAQGDRTGAIAAYEAALQSLQTIRGDLVAMNPAVQFSFRQSVEPVYRQLVMLLLQMGTPTQADLRQARSTIEALQLAELDNFYRAACVSANPILLDQVVDQVDPAAAVVYPIILADHLEVILKLPRQLELQHYSVSLPPGQVEKILEQLQQQLTRPYTTPEGKALARQVYDWLIRPAEAMLAQYQVETLAFVMDGSLRNLPMAALYDGRHYLVERYRIARAPGLQLLDMAPLAQQPLQVLKGGLTEARQGFAALPYVGQELRAIQSIMPGRTLLNQAFTVANLQQQFNAHPFSIVHLATHGQFSSRSADTFLLAWDRRINVNELHELFLATDRRQTAIQLLVLSACKTAAGDRRAALGLAGIALRAGARSTLASLWYADDQSSALLIQSFYQGLGQGMSKAAALRHAQLQLLKSPDFRHPAYWAGFVLLGNWL